MKTTYKSAGVDIDAGNLFAKFIRNYPSKAIGGNLGGFSAGFEIDADKYEHPVVMSTTDGVGTKLLVAQKLGIYDTVGIDLVAMCVNDLIVSGAEPHSFLDYIACGKINQPVFEDLVKGIVTGCEEAECLLSGGETAEMPGMYDPDEFDLAGFAIGVADKRRLLPKKEQIRSGDPIIGLPSSGIHSNGFSLARKVIPESETELRKELLTPTRIYVKDVKKLISTGLIRAAAHITGGGLRNNLMRVMPDGMEPDLKFDWKMPSVFDALQQRGSIDDEEMRRVFNVGIGLALIVPREDSDAFVSFGREAGIELQIIGEVITI